MAELIKLTRAEVITYGKDTETVIKEYKTDKGGFIFSFKVQTRVNDKVGNSPRVFRKCSYFAKTEEEAGKIRSLIKKGALIEVEGSTNRKNFDDKETGKTIYYDEVEVKYLVAIQTGSDASETVAEEDLPF
jgi:single-stranded DNA-binding protein